MNHRQLVAQAWFVQHERLVVVSKAPAQKQWAVGVPSESGSHPKVDLPVVPGLDIRLLMPDSDRRLLC